MPLIRRDERLLHLPAPGELTLHLPPRALDAGSYTLRVTPAGAAGAVASYRFTVTPDGKEGAQ